MIHKNTDKEPIYPKQNIADDTTNLSIAMVVASFLISLMIAVTFAETRPTGLKLAEKSVEVCQHNKNVRGR